MQLMRIPLDAAQVREACRLYVLGHVTIAEDLTPRIEGVGDGLIVVVVLTKKRKSKVKPEPAE